MYTITGYIGDKKVRYERSTFIAAEVKFAEVVAQMANAEVDVIAYDDVVYLSAYDNEGSRIHMHQTRAVHDTNINIKMVGRMNKHRSWNGGWDDIAYSAREKYIKQAQEELLNDEYATVYWCGADEYYYDAHVRMTRTQRMSNYRYQFIMGGSV